MRTRYVPAGTAPRTHSSGFELVSTFRTVMPELFESAMPRSELFAQFRLANRLVVPVTVTL